MPISCLPRPSADSGLIVAAGVGAASLLRRELIGNAHWPTPIRTSLALDHSLEIHCLTVVARRKRIGVEADVQFLEFWETATTNYYLDAESTPGREEISRSNKHRPCKRVKVATIAKLLPFALVKLILRGLLTMRAPESLCPPSTFTFDARHIARRRTPVLAE